MSSCSWCNLSDEDKKWKLYENDTWDLYLADKQDYVGRCILVLKRHCGSLSELTDSEWIDLKRIINLLEPLYKDVLDADLSNWSCLLNDFYKKEHPNPHLHIHVRPRYSKPIQINDTVYADNEFGHHYDNYKENNISDADMSYLYRLLKNAIAGDKL